LNLLITCARHFEFETQNEIRTILEELGDEHPNIVVTRLSGILKVETTIEPFQVVKKIKNMIITEPWSIRYCLRVIPIQVITDTNLESISTKVNSLIGRIKKDQTYRITVEKRNSNISSDKIISKIANNIQNKVSLEESDWIVLIEILGNEAGVAVLKAEDILSVQKAKRALSD